MNGESLENTTQATDATGTTENQAQAGKTYTQEEFDKHMAGMRKAIEQKFERQFSELGDLNELRQLKRITERLNTQYHQYEFLWSHPKYGGHSTAVPVIIQQDQKRLESIRNRTKSR